MAAIVNLTQYNWFVVVSAIVAAMIAFKALSELWDWFVKRFGIETKSMRERRESGELLKKTSELANSTAQGLTNLEKAYKSDEKKFHSKLNTHIDESKSDRENLHKAVDKLADLILDNTTHSMRWEILKFGADLSNGRKYNAEAFRHVLKSYDKYEGICDEHGIKNSVAEQTVEFIRDVYKEGLKDGTIE